MSNNAATGATVRHTTTHLPSWIPRTQYQVIAAFIWVAGALATELLVRSLGCPFGYSYLVAIAVQYGFTKIEAPMWRNQKNVVSFTVLLFDVFVNAGGLFDIVQRLSNAPLWTMLYKLDMVGATMGSGVAFAVSLLVGFLIAIAPEKIWRW